MEQLAIKLLGFAAATCTTLAYAPQFVKVWKTRSTEDISLGMFLVMVLGILLWLLYGLLSGDAPLIVANAITIVLAGGILWMKLKYGWSRGSRKQTRLGDGPEQVSADTIQLALPPYRIRCALAREPDCACQAIPETGY